MLLAVPSSAGSTAATVVFAAAASATYTYVTEAWFGRLYGTNLRWVRFRYGTLLRDRPAYRAF